VFSSPHEFCGRLLERFVLEDGSWSRRKRSLLGYFPGFAVLNLPCDILTHLFFCHEIVPRFSSHDPMEVGAILVVLVPLDALVGTNAFNWRFFVHLYVLSLPFPIVV